MLFLPKYHHIQLERFQNSLNFKGTCKGNIILNLHLKACLKIKTAAICKILIRRRWCRELTGENASFANGKNLEDKGVSQYGSYNCDYWSFRNTKPVA